MVVTHKSEVENMWKFGKKSTEKQMQEYMAFYFPSKSACTYEILFDWGMYTITPESKMEEDVHEDSRRYSGFITMRPTVTNPSNEHNLPVYLITPDGEVWKNESAESIPPMNTRKEIIVEKSDSSTTTKTVTIESVSEPVIDHFRENTNQWQLYGILQVSGNKSRLKLVAN